MSETWQPLGEVAPDELVDARINLHWAAQVVSGVGRTFLEKKKDDSHTNLDWLDSDRLASHTAAGETEFRAALDFAGFRLLYIDVGSQKTHDYALKSRKLEEAYEWLGKAIQSLAKRPLPGGEFVELHYEMPEHPIGEGEPFQMENPEAFAELGRWFHNADRVLRVVQSSEADASPVRTWPHHFDMATLIELDKGKDVEKPRTIGVGLSPGDDNYKEPYWYVNVYPAPEDLQAVKWPTLEGAGHWHTTGFTAAVLPGTSMVDTDNQPGQLKEFLDSALAGCKKIHGME